MVIDACNQRIGAMGLPVFAIAHSNHPRLAPADPLLANRHGTRPLKSPLDLPDGYGMPNCPHCVDNVFGNDKRTLDRKRATGQGFGQVAFGRWKALVDYSTC